MYKWARLASASPEENLQRQNEQVQSLPLMGYKVLKEKE